MSVLNMKASDLWRGGSANWSGVLALVCAFWLNAAVASAEDPLASWNAGPAKQAILDFVAAVSTQGSPDHVPPSERIAVFDNDGTLWVEQPIYTQVLFALQRVRDLAPEHPQWREQQPFKAALEGDTAALGEVGAEGLAQMLVATHSGMTSEEFRRIVSGWLATARHPRFERPFTELVYQPMLELLAYLRANEFKTFIVSGGGLDFMRPWTERVYGIPPEQVVGSALEIKYEERDGEPVIVRLPEFAFVDDKEGKPVGIWRHIGRRPILAHGNSDGDLQMLKWITAGEGRRLGLILHHDDAEREYSYDRESHVGKLDTALDAAVDEGWSVVSMKSDWKRVFPAESLSRP